ncbi:MAG: toxin-antitoxin system YwqK family antitoxin [Prolixibacteraceae bacterium]
MGRIVKYLSFILLGVISYIGSLAAQTKEINQLDNNGKKTGIWVVKRSDGTIKYRGLFEDGKPKNKLYRYHKNGKLKCVLDFANNDADTVMVSFYDTLGVKATTGRYVQKKKDGTWKVYESGRLLIATLQFKKNVLDGVARTYYNNGSIKSVAQWKEGKLSGNKFEYYKGGEIRSRSQYKDGIEFGIHRELYRDEKVRFEGNIENGLKQGIWRYYDPKGNLKCELHYIDDILQNPEELDKLTELEIPTKEESKKRFIDPKDFIYNPMQYIQQINHMHKGY